MPEVNIIVRLKDEASKGLQNLGGNLHNIGKGAALVGGGITAVGAGLTALAIQAAPVETIRAAFEGLAESSGESADTLLAALQKGSAGMISQKDLMTSYNKAAQLVSTTFANQLPNALGYLSKVAASTGQDMGYMLDSLVVGVGRGSKMILDNLGITVDLDQAYQDWADSLGIAKDAMTDEQKQAGLMNQVMTLLAENTAAMPDITGTAAQGIGEMKAALADTKDEIGMAFLPVLQELLPIFRDLMDRFLPPLIDLISRFADWFKQLSPVVQIAVAAFGPMLTILGGVMMALAPLVPAITAVVSAIIGIGTPIGWIVGIIAGLIAIVGMLAAAWANNWGGIQDKVRWVWENVLQPIFAFIGEALNFLATVVLPYIQAAFESAWSFIRDLITAVWEAIKPHLLELQDVLRKFWTEIQPRLQEAWAAIHAAMLVVQEWVKTTLIPALQDLWDRLEPVREIIIKVAAAFAGFMASAFVTALKGWLSMIIGLWDGMASAIGGVIDAIREVLGWIQRAIDAWRRFTAAGVGGGGGEGPGGSPLLQGGLAYVPATMPAIIHRGEAVLTREQAARWRMGQGGPDIHIHMSGDMFGISGVNEAVQKVIEETGRYAV